MRGVSAVPSHVGVGSAGLEMVLGGAWSWGFCLGSEVGGSRQPFPSWEKLHLSQTPCPGTWIRLSAPPEDKGWGSGDALGNGFRLRGHGEVLGYRVCWGGRALPSSSASSGEAQQVFHGPFSSGFILFFFLWSSFLWVF